MGGALALVSALHKFFMTLIWFSGETAIEILLIEDNQGDIKLIRIALKIAHLANTIHIVKNGEAGLDFVFQRPPYETKPRPQLILLDINLPKMNGIEVLTEIKNNESTSDIPVIMLTSSEAESDIAESYSHFAYSFITKPADTKGFFEVMRRLENFWFTHFSMPGNQA